MSEETKPEEEPEEKKEEVQPSFPSLENGPSVVYEKDKHEIWIGLPLEKIGDPLILMAVIDGSKMAALNYFRVYLSQMQARKQFEISPTGKHVNGVMKDLFMKGKSLVGLGSA